MMKECKGGVIQWMGRYEKMLQQMRAKMKVDVDLKEPERLCGGRGKERWAGQNCSLGLYRRALCISGRKPPREAWAGQKLSWT